MSTYDDYLTKEREARDARVAGFKSQMTEVARQLSALFVQSRDDDLWAEKEEQHAAELATLDTIIEGLE